MPSIVNKVKYTPFGPFKKVLQLGRWFVNASSIDQLDSPFLFEFYQEVVRRKINDPKVDEIEATRANLLNDKTLLSLIDYGSGSYTSTKKERTVSAIAKSAVSDPRKCSLLYKICRHVSPNNILELGTSLGVSTMYLKAGAPRSCVTTVEGDPGLSTLFHRTRRSWAEDITLINDTFQSAISELSQSSQQYDLVYIDGSHNSEALLTLVESLRSMTNRETWLIIDDIYWSRDMMEAWAVLKSSPDYNLAIDMWYFGLLRYDSRIKESLSCKMPPLHLRWQTGFSR